VKAEAKGVRVVAREVEQAAYLADGQRDQRGTPGTWRGWLRFALFIPTWGV
jgi:hypothetical protein